MAVQSKRPEVRAMLDRFAQDLLGDLPQDPSRWMRDELVGHPVKRTNT